MAASAPGSTYSFAAADRHPVFRTDHHRHREGAAERPSALIWVGLLIGVLHASLGVANVVTADLWISAVFGLLIAGIGKPT